MTKQDVELIKQETVSHLQYSVTKSLKDLNIDIKPNELIDVKNSIENFLKDIGKHKSTNRINYINDTSVNIVQNNNPKDQYSMTIEIQTTNPGLIARLKN